MFKGQPRKPLFKTGELVHAVSPSTAVTSKAESSQAVSQATSSTLAKPSNESVSLSVPRETLFTITSVEESFTDTKSHVYRVALASPGKVTFDLEEKELVKAGEFNKGDFVVKKWDPKNEVYQVDQVTLTVGTGLTKPIPSVVMHNELGMSEVSAADALRRATNEEAEQWYPMID